MGYFAKKWKNLQNFYTKMTLGDFKKLRDFSDKTAATDVSKVLSDKARKLKLGFKRKNGL